MISHKKNLQLIVSWAVLLGALLCFSRPAQAAPADSSTIFEETELMFIGEELYTVSIASRKAEPLQRAPAAVTVIQGDELRKYRTLSEVLRRVPGFFVDRNELKERIYLRGVPDSFLVMMDGVPFSSDASTQDYPRGMELSLDYIEKIEIVRGPGSALWGPDAFSGVVNLVTRKGETLQGAALKVETGSYDTFSTSAQGGFSRNGWDGFVFGSRASTEGFEHDLARRERREDRFGEAYGRLSYKDLFEISARYSRYRDYYTEPSFFIEGSEHKAFSFVQATVNKSFEKSSLSLQAWFQYFDSLEDGDDSRYEQINRQYGAEAKYDLTLFENNFATVGLSFRYNDGSKTKLKYDDLEFEYFPSYQTRLNSVYFQDKWKVLDDLELTFGIRYDYHSEYKNFTSPRFGLNYIFLDYFNLKLLYGRAFRTPTLAVVREEIGLNPEKIDSYEAELGFHYKNLLSCTINYFYNELDDIIERNALGEISNGGNENIKGLEISLAWRPHPSLSLYANYSRLLGSRQRGARTLQELRDPDNPDQTIETTLESFFNVAPDHIYNFGIDYFFLDHFRVSLEGNYVHNRKLARFDNRLYGGRRKLSSYFLFDVSLFVTDLPLENLEIALKIKNITDKNYNTRGVFGLVEGEGSSMYLMMRYRY